MLGTPSMLGFPINLRFSNYSEKQFPIGVNGLKDTENRKNSKEKMIIKWFFSNKIKKVDWSASENRNGKWK